MKTLQNNFTTPEQSKRLLELGIPADSADCYFDALSYIRARQTPNELWKDLFKDYDSFIPCWSVGRLIEIFDICGNKKQCADELPLPSKIEEAYKTTYIAFLIKIFATGIICFDFSKLKD